MIGLLPRFCRANSGSSICTSFDGLKNSGLDREQGLAELTAYGASQQIPSGTAAYSAYKVRMYGAIFAFASSSIEGLANSD
ncbi:MAG: hypothetical protein JWR25_1188 [Noviherbaspirillum sp.]|nr:hypothetical protein [Noviherbaspirillum sp.]